MLGRTLARGVTATVLQTHTPSTHAGSQHSILQAWLMHKKTDAHMSPTVPKATSSAHNQHGTLSFLYQSNDVQYETPCHTESIQYYKHILHSQSHRLHTGITSSMPAVPKRIQNHHGTSFILQRKDVQYKSSYHTLNPQLHHLRTDITSSIPLIATRSLVTLTNRSPSTTKTYDRCLPSWSPRGIVIVGNMALGVRGMASKGGFKNLHGQLSSIQLKKRMQRKKKKIQEESEEEGEEVAGFGTLSRHKFLTFDPDFTLPEMHDFKPPLREWQVAAYATADEYDLEELLKGLTQQGLYSAVSFASSSSHGTSASPQAPSSQPYSLSSPSSETKPDAHKLPDPSEVLHVRATYRLESEAREIYFFRSGAVVFWNVAELERNSVLRFLGSYQEGAHDERTVQEECERLTYTYNDTGAHTKLVRDTICLNPEGPTDLEKYTFSNALAQSVQLGIWEAALDEYIDNIEYVSEELSKTGLVVLSEHQVLQRMGQLFALRHLVNLSSDLLDVPDFYWEHENLEQLYRKTSEYLSVSKRTSVLNVKLSHCVELMELLKSHLNERHSARLEWIIIILIMVEVGFELLHFLERLL